MAGNCGVGFAPAAPDRHEWLIALMEGVEDIPGAALSEGIRWDWETFPQYLDALEKSTLAIDIGTHVPHGAVRAYVMGERGAKNEAATAKDIEQMYEIVKEGLLAGALGFSTSRTMGHRALDGEPVPGSFAQEDELFGIGRALKDTGLGVFELAGAGAAGDAGGDGPDDALKEIDWMQRLSIETGRPVSFAVLQFDSRPNQWRELMRTCEASAKRGGNVIAQFAARPFGILVGHQTTANPLMSRPAYVEIASLPLPERVKRLRDPQVKARILSAERVGEPGWGSMLDNPGIYARLFPMGDPPDYEPTPDQSIAAIAKREGRSAEELLYEHMLRDEGRELLLLPFFNYSDGDLEPFREMLDSEQTVLSLGRRWCALRRHLRRVAPDLHADPLGARPDARAEDRPRARGAPHDAAHGAALRAARPRCGRPRLQGRPERDRLRATDAPPPADGLRSSGRRAATDPARVGLREEDRERSGRDGARRADRCDARPAAARCAGAAELGAASRSVGSAPRARGSGMRIAPAFVRRMRSRVPTSAPDRRPTEHGSF